MLDDVRSIWELIARRVAATPDRVMLHDGDRRTTFAEYRDLAERAAAGLAGLGVGAAFGGLRPLRRAKPVRHDARHRVSSFRIRLEKSESSRSL